MLDDYIDHIENALALAKQDATKFKKGNKSAGTRVRAYFQEIKGSCQSARELILEEAKKQKT